MKKKFFRFVAIYASEIGYLTALIINCAVYIALSAGNSRLAYVFVSIGIVANLAWAIITINTITERRWKE